MQTPRQSLLESITNTLIGVAINMICSPLIYWIVGIDMSASKMGVITILFTLVSIVRGYVIRRWFNKREMICGKPLHFSAVSDAAPADVYTRPSATTEALP